MACFSHFLDNSGTFCSGVNVWEYEQPDKLYGGFTTRDRDKHYISYKADKHGQPVDGSQYTYFGDGFAFVRRSDYEAWRDTFRGVEFKGNWPNQTVVFTYKRIEKLVSEDEYNALALPVDTRLMNASIIDVKVEYDDELHTVTEYRYSNVGQPQHKVRDYAIVRQSQRA